MNWSRILMMVLPALYCVMVEAEETFINLCTQPYSEGSVSKPCTLCGICLKNWNEELKTTEDSCAKHLYFNTYSAAVKKTTPFIIASLGKGKTVCAMKQFCHPDSFTCSFPIPSGHWKEERVALLPDCKCRCDATHYGQTCNLEIPPELSIDSFADVQNIVYIPIIYAAEFATIYVYFYTTGVDLSVELTTETQMLRYDSAACTEDIPPLQDLCGTLFEDGGIRDYRVSCEGGPTYEEHRENTVCALVVHVAFAKVRLGVGDKMFLFDDEDGSKSKSDAKVVARVERVTLTVFNRIPNLAETGATVLSTVFGITVLYKGETPFEECPVLVTIPQYSKKSETAPSFPRSQVIALTNLVVLQKVPGCENLGEPTTNWFLWDLKVNHDEKEDPPFRQMFGTPTLTYESFSLPFGKYKVKSTVRFVERHFDRAFAYCYFEIIAMPLQPMVFGGSSRYIYYKSNLDLINDILVDPNYPITAQPKLTRVWYCNDTKVKLCDQISGDETVITKYGPFTPGHSYYFTLSVKSPMLPLESCHQTIIISKHPIPSLLIECLRNCGGKGFKSDTREIFYFKVFHSNQSSDEVKVNDHYEWTYSTGDASFSDVQAVRQVETTPSWILIVNENSLQNNQEYTFKVTGGGEVSGEAQITVHMFKYTDTFKCTINPKKGVAGQTKFTIECNKAEFEQNHLSLNIYFYDKFKEEDESGRLVGSNYMELIEDVVLTRGTVMVSATNMFGQFQKTHVKVALTPPNITHEFLDDSILALRGLSENEGYDQKLSYMSSLCDVLTKEPSIKEQYTETFLEILGEEDAIDLVHLELLLSVTESILCDGPNCTGIEMSDRAYRLLSDILTGVSNKLVKELHRTTTGPSNLPTSKVNLLYTSLLKCTGIFLSVQNKHLADNHSATIDYNLYNIYKVGNMKVLNSLDRVNEALSLKNIPFIKHSSVRTEMVETWMKEDRPIYFTGGSKGNYSGSYLVMTRALAKSLAKKSFQIVVNVMAFKNNPYWWSQTEDVSTQVVSVSIGHTKDLQSYTPIKSFIHHIDIFLKKKGDQKVTVSGVVTQPDPDIPDDVLNKDLAVNVHQIYVLKGESISLKFINLTATDVFRVSVMKDRRPDYDMVLNGIKVTYASPWYRSPRNIKVTEDSDVVFVGILPGAAVPANESRAYTFELQSARCQVWYDFLWDASGCSLGPNSSKEYLHCQCTHLSSLAGFIGVPINSINPLKDYTLFLTIPDNPFVLAFILMILLVYALLMIWAYRANMRDRLRTGLIILEDNISDDSCGYLVIVFTGSRFYAGTTSHIGLILHGNLSSSRSHILRSSKRPTLNRNTDDWFLIYTPKSLGVISSVQVWSNHEGASPNWFCDRIHVHDLGSDKDYSFLIGKWFGVTQLETRVESFARPIKLELNANIVDFFLTNIVFGFRESHVWVSVLAKHPRSPMTRAQRLSIAMVTLVATLVGCILFYDAAMPEDEDLPEYSVSTREALISIYSVAISVAATGLVFAAFSKSYTYKQLQDVPVSSTSVRVDSADHLRQRKRATRGYSYYIKKMIISLRQNDFYPVQAVTDKEKEKQIIVHKARLVLAWILSTSVILVCCFFTVWIGLKIGKNKSLLWLTSIAMALTEDLFIMDPIKICTIALLFGLVQTQLCNLYNYDPRVFEMRKSVTKNFVRDEDIHKMRLFEPIYKPVPMGRLEAIQNQQRVIKKWWALIDIVDIFFSVIVIFCIIQDNISKDYFLTNSGFKNIVFNRINPYEDLTPSPAVHSVSSYSTYLQDSVFSAIYSTQWYNDLQLTAQTESFAETGWTKTLTHRMIGVPRLRQIRVDKEACRLPTEVLNLTMYCNVLYSGGTEDTEYYSAQWGGYTSEYVDVIFDKSPWLYTFPEEVGPFAVSSLFTQTGELFHGAGYIAELTRTRRRSAGTLLNLVDLDWLDMRTRIVFFEMSAYNVNNNIFTAIIFNVEHLETGLVLASITVRSSEVKRDDALLEVIYVLYSVLALVKMSMVLGTVGPKRFFSSFWTLYDLCFVLVGLVFVIGYRIALTIHYEYIHDFQRSEKEDFFPFAGLFFTETLVRYIIALLFIFATARSLRLLKYEPSSIHIKHRYTLYFAWPQILCVTFVLLLFMFSYQRLLEYLVDCLYPLGTSHWLQHKMNFRDLQRATVTPNTMFFVYIPCFLSSIGLVFNIVVLVESYSRAHQVYAKMLQENTS